jgi:hypothetical protein
VIRIRQSNDADRSNSVFQSLSLCFNVCDVLGLRCREACGIVLKAFRQATVRDRKNREDRNWDIGELLLTLQDRLIRERKFLRWLRSSR